MHPQAQLLARVEGGVYPIPFNPQGIPAVTGIGRHDGDFKAIFFASHPPPGPSHPGNLPIVRDDPT